MARLFVRLSLLSVLLCASGCVTVPKPAVVPAVPQAGQYHIVASGETLWRISRNYNVDLHELMRLNHITDPGQLEAGQRLCIPGAFLPLPPVPVPKTDIKTIEAIVGPKQYVCRWRSITIHHSATREGDAEVFDRNHRKRGMGGLFYHFVIGNGTDSGDGSIEVGWRWKKQAQVERKNDIQICLVGDFNVQQVSQKQFDALAGLVAVLCKQYAIPLRNIRKHKSIKGKHTACPGSHFPFDRLIAVVKQTGI